ncbi:Ribonuclease P protein component [Enhydrobacter sp. 8BJ]|nr:ribonuclease P protein component [Enhydrobacter sp. 8BJ]VXA97705.1 Ribonuclease P protein component [Enhydrobacter sp. 8BJ]
MTADKPFKFDKSQRLLTPKDFKAMSGRHTKTGEDQSQPVVILKIHQPNLLFFVKVVLSDTQKQTLVSRLGLAITKKKVKRAHERNRIKRLTREYFRLHQHQLNGQVDILLTIKQFSDDTPNEAIVQQLAMGFNLINVKIRKLKRS